MAHPRGLARRACRCARRVRSADRAAIAGALSGLRPRQRRRLRSGRLAARPPRGRATAPDRRRAPARQLLSLERGGDLRPAALPPPRLSRPCRAGGGIMNYFARLAQRAGIAAPAAPPPLRDCAGRRDAAPASEVAPLEQTIEVVARRRRAGARSGLAASRSGADRAHGSRRGRASWSLRRRAARRQLRRPALEADDAPREPTTHRPAVAPEPSAARRVNARPTSATSSARAAANADVSPPAASPLCSGCNDRCGYHRRRGSLPAARPPAPDRSPAERDRGVAAPSAVDPRRTTFGRCGPAGRRGHAGR